jgi:hypothetical protein
MAWASSSTGATEQTLRRMISGQLDQNQAPPGRLGYTGELRLTRSAMPRQKIPELICPAGSLPALKAAVDNGADTVYLGYKQRHQRAQFRRPQL